MLELEQTPYMPRWAYFDEELLELEKQALFRKNWLLVGHVNDMPAPRDFLTLDAVGERAIVIRDHGGQINAFHNVCQHRGAKLKDSLSGSCENMLMCPFHGWTYQLDGTLVGVPAERTFKALDKRQRGLLPLDCEIWMGFIFVRFLKNETPGNAASGNETSGNEAQGNGASVADNMRPLQPMFESYQTQNMHPLPGSSYAELRPYNWKIIHDIDNEGYHLPIGHPALQQLYGQEYTDTTIGDIPLAIARLNDKPAQLWSVRQYQKILPRYAHLPDEYQRLWQYGFNFPTMIFGLYPDSMEFYMTIPVGVNETIYRGGRYGLADDSRATRAARYLCQRINDETDMEDENFVRWLQDGMQSSAFPEPNLSSLESGVQRYHNTIQAILPVTKLKNHPGKGKVAEINRLMLGDEAEG